jgi:hypothetical protein
LGTLGIHGTLLGDDPKSKDRKKYFSNTDYYIRREETEWKAK